MLAELTTHQDRLGLPPRDASADDPRQRIGRAITYYTHHQSRMNYPEYRRLGAHEQQSGECAPEIVQEAFPTLPWMREWRCFVNSEFRMGNSDKQAIAA